jgi:homocitrate synthase NifV
VAGMIYITDRTLSALDDMTIDVSVLARFLELLIQTEPDAIELSQKMYDLLSPLFTAPLREYPGYIIRNGDTEACEILLDDIQDLNTAARFKDCEKIRVQGLDDILTGDYLKSFARLREFFSGEIEFCPTNRCNFATALAVEWLTSSGAESVKSVAASFGGIGGFAATEEVIMILKLAGLRKPEKTYDFFPEMASLLDKITAKPISRNKPILGECIFHVESGIHVDGIMKDPKCYEPFPPETVGLKRKIVIGKNSGTASIKAKLAELGIPCEEEKIPAVLEDVRAKSEEKRGALNDREFAELVRGCVA